MEEDNDIDYKKAGYIFLILSLVLAGWGYYVYQDNLGFTRFSITLFVIAGISGILYLIMLYGEKQNKAEMLCYDLIINRGVQSLGELASLTGKSIADVKFNVEQLIKEEKIDMYIEDRYIYEYDDDDEYEDDEDTVPRATIVSCKSCGANNSIADGQRNCEYCGGPLV